MFLRKFYLNLIKVLNHPFLLKYVNLFSFNHLIMSESDIRQKDFFKKFYLCVFPNFYHSEYNLLNKSTLRLIRFRKKFLPNFSHRFEKYISHEYSVIDEDFMFEYFDFLQEQTPSDLSNLKKIFKSQNDLFSLYLMFIFLKKHFFHYFSMNFFYSFKQSNLTKVSFVFTKIFFQKTLCDNKLIFLDTKKYSNWFLTVDCIYFNKSIILENIDLNSDSLYSDKKTNELFSNFDKNIRNILIDDIKPYVDLYSDACWSLYSKVTYKLIRTVFNVKINLNNLWDVCVDSNFFKKINNLFPYRYSDSSLNKFINLSKIDNFIFFFLRKSKIFNKGRYSRNRQTYRTGFYWCLWLNIFVVYGLHFVFYRFTFTFGYLWVFLFIFFGSFIFSRALKYNLITFNSIISEVVEFFNFLKFFFIFFLVFFKKLLLSFLVFFKKLFNIDDSFLKVSDVSFSDFDDKYLNLIHFEKDVIIRNRFLKKIYNDVDNYFSEIFKLDVDMYFDKNSSNFFEKPLSELSIEFVYLTDAHDIASDIIEERIWEYQRDLILKLRNEK